MDNLNLQPVESTESKSEDVEVSINFSALACSILNQAFEDAMGNAKAFTGPKSKADNQLDAIRFLTTQNEDLEFWCQMGGLNSKAINNASKKQLASLGH